jgi:hypothetical protein
MTHGTNTSEKFWVFDGMSDEYVDALLRGWLEKRGVRPPSRLSARSRSDAAPPRAAERDAARIQRASRHRAA